MIVLRVDGTNKQLPLNLSQARFKGRIGKSTGAGLTTYTCVENNGEYQKYLTRGPKCS